MTAAFDTLTGDDASFERRREAAKRLLTSDNTQRGAQLLTDAISTRYSATVWRPTLDALAVHETSPPKVLVEPLLALAPEADAALQADLAAVLGRLINDDLASRLMAIVRDPQRALALRRTAVLTLGHHRTREAAGFLVALTEPQQASSLRRAAFDALQTLTGLHHHDADADAWADWWRAARERSAQQWHEQLMRTLGRQAQRQRAESDKLSERLQELLREQYRAASAEQRPQMLVRMLNDPLEPVRALGMTLAVQRLVNDGDFDEATRAALRERLADSAPELRQRATLLLRDLADDPAADRVAQRLADNEESVAAVMTADLLMLTRMPRVAAVQPAASLLDHPALRADAAGMLAAAAEADLLEPVQVARIRKQVYDSMHDQGPMPPVVRLLGRIGNVQDWQRIEQWLDHESPGVRQAAARAWSESEHALSPLAQRAGDPEIGPVFVLAAMRRGETRETWQALIEHQPQTTAQANNWHRALATVAGHIPVDVVLHGVDQLKAQNVGPAVRESLLSAAMQRFESPSPSTNESTTQNTTENTPQDVAQTQPADLTEDATTQPAEQASNAQDERVASRQPTREQQHGALLIARADVRLEAARIEPALSDLERAAEFEDALLAAQRDAVAQGVIRAHLLDEDIERAVELARQRIEDAEGTGAIAQRVAYVFINVTTDHLLRDRREQAARVLDALRTVIRETGIAFEQFPFGHEVTERMAMLEQQLQSSDTEAPHPNGGATTQPAEDREATASDGGESVIDLQTTPDASATQPTGDDQSAGMP